jgi:hypothetical protein
MQQLIGPWYLEDKEGSPLSKGGQSQTNTGRRRCRKVALAPGGSTKAQKVPKARAVPSLHLRILQGQGGKGRGSGQWVAGGELLP